MWTVCLYGFGYIISACERVTRFWYDICYTCDTKRHSLNLERVVLLRCLIVNVLGSCAIFTMGMLSCLWCSTAYAHGGEPLPRQLLSTGDGQWVLKTNFGLIRSQDPTRFICEESFLGGDDFLVQVLGTDQWVIATDTNIITTNDGCVFEKGMALKEVPKSLESSPSRQSVMFITNDSSLSSTLWISEDRGKSFAPLSTGAADVFWTGGRFIDESRIFLSGYAREGDDKGSARFIVVTVPSRDVQVINPKSSLRYPYVFDGANGMVAGIAADEASGDLMLFYDEPDVLGEVLEPLAVWPTDIELSKDGQSVWVAQSGSATGARYGKRSAEGVQWAMVLNDVQLFCVAFLDEVLFACTDRDETGAEVIQHRAPDRIPQVQFKSLVGARRDCPATSTVSKTCPLIWKEIAKQLRIPIVDMAQEMDMGSSDMDDPMDQTPDMQPPAETPSDEGCASAGGQAPVCLVWLWLVGAVYWRRRRTVSALSC